VGSFSGFGKVVGAQSESCFVPQVGKDLWNRVLNKVPFVGEVDLLEPDSDVLFAVNNNNDFNNSNISALVQYNDFPVIVQDVESASETIGGEESESSVESQLEPEPRRSQ